MERWFYFVLKRESTVAEGLEELLPLGVSDVSILEEAEEEKTFFCARAEINRLPFEFVHIRNIIPIDEEIDWNSQWRQFCPYFSDGLCKIPLADFFRDRSEYIILTPGPGFGDLSHPTTRLTLELTDLCVKDKIVADIGCGSGVLGFFALALGARKVYALDIDPKALEHTKENALLNGFEDKLTVDFLLAEGVLPDIALLNMTFEEQKQALASFPVKSCSEWITSGILKEQEAEYLLFMKGFGLTVKKRLEKDGWLAFIFLR